MKATAQEKLSALFEARKVNQKIKNVQHTGGIYRTVFQFSLPKGRVCVFYFGRGKDDTLVKTFSDVYAIDGYHVYAAYSQADDFIAERTAKTMKICTGKTRQDGFNVIQEQE